MNQYDAFNRLLQIIINNERHANYDETVKLAKDYTAYSTGDGLNEKLKKVNSRQTDEAFNEQKNVTIHITKSIISRLTHIFNRVPRSNSVKTSYKVEAETQAVEFDEILDNFGRSGFNDYMETRLKDLCELDPNAFLVAEFMSTDGTERAKPYPLEVKSEQAIMYEYDQSKLEYLVNRVKTVKTNKNGIAQKTADYVIYTSEGVVLIEQLPDNERYMDLKDVTEPIDPPEVFNIDRDSYRVTIPEPYELESVPARQIGYINHKSMPDVFVNYYDNIVPYLDKLIKANSEMDISIAKHVHPQRIQYVRKCVHEGCHACNDGVYKIYIDDETEGEVERICPTCKGLGYMDTTTSGIEYIYFPLPDLKEEMINLGEIVKYIAVDIQTPEFLDTYIKQITAMCQSVMFNQETIAGEAAAKVLTATEIIINDDNRSDTLRPYAVNYVNNYAFYLDIISQIVDIEVEVQASVSKDFNMRGLAEWTEILNQLILAGANEYIIASVQVEIWRLLHGETNISNEYKTANVLIPFLNLSREKQALILGTLDKRDKYRVAAIYGTSFLQQLQMQDEMFFELNFEERKRRFDELVQERINEMKPDALPFPGNIGE